MSKSVLSTGSLRTFLLDVQIPIERIDEFLTALSKRCIKTESDFRGYASLWNLEAIGFHDVDSQHIMKALFADSDFSQNSTIERFLVDAERIQSIPSSLQHNDNVLSAPRLTRDAVITFQEIGRGASGRVSKALFAPSLTLVAIKRIEIKDAIMRKVVGQELKFLYEVARSQLAIPEIQQADDKHLNLLSGQLYSDVIAGCHTFPSPKIVKSDNGGAKSAKTTPSVQAANSPYIINFYDAYIDPQYGAVCLVLEYMNAGSIQNMLNDGKKFNEDDAAVLAFSVLNALFELHSRNILHRDIKPSNILSNSSGNVKLTDFGITKEMLEENKCADSFIGTLAYMSPDRLRGLQYSFEADMWSLGITMITIMTGKPPFPINRGPWHLMNAIIQGPQPTLDPLNVSVELQDFIHECLNQQARDCECARELLGHSFLSLARKRGTLPETTPPLLHPGTLISCTETTEDLVDKIVEAAISWQLECFDSQQIFDHRSLHNGHDISQDEVKFDVLPAYHKLTRFSLSKIRRLAAQMLVDSSVLEEKFSAKYEQIDALYVEGWNIDGLRKALLPRNLK